MSRYVLNFREIDQTKLEAVGGKGANLGELARIKGIRVPAGFCITTAAFQRVTAATPAAQVLLDRLAGLTVEDREQISETSGELRQAIAGTAIPDNIAAEITQEVARLGANAAYAVRSSATAEDLPGASFAGQQDTFLNVAGIETILEHLRQCWASLFTERAVIYRMQNGFDHRKVQLAVVVQQMVFADAAGIMFTADPVTGNRKVLSIDAGFGLGEALVAGLVNADLYQVRDGKITAKQIAAKKLAVTAAQDGGTQQEEIEPGRQSRQVLADEQILELARLSRKIEEHFGRPQDIEWCLTEDTFYFVQSRPITTLFPIPATNDEANHVYISVGHQQMMTDAIKPLGISFWQSTALRPMFTAGGRLFVDVTNELVTPAMREILLNGLGRSDPLIKDALLTVLERGDFIKAAPSDSSGSGAATRPPAWAQALAEPSPTDVADLIGAWQAAQAELAQAIQAQAGPELIEFIWQDIQQLKAMMSDPRSMAVILGGMNAAAWINDKMGEWLGEKNPADTLAQSAPNNVTAEMGLALLDVADVIRPYPDVIDYLQQARDEDFLAGLDALKGGPPSRDAIRAFLAKYGMRCSGEIDITRTRWSEQPTTLVPLILSNIRNFAPGEAQRKFEQGRQEAAAKAQELLDRLQQLPDGAQKAAATKQTIDRIRTCSGYREYPKYAMMGRYFEYKQALLAEAERLVQAGVLRDREDIYHLTFDELRDVVRTHQLDDALVSRGKDEFNAYAKLAPPRVLTSDGEMIAGAYRRDDLPAGALAGLAVSAGVVEGRARVILRMEETNLEEGDILVTTFTDPSWTPLFVAVRGLVTEVGGLMTHGAVIAREYGLPAVVGVENATRLIQDGQRIRVNGAEGYVEILEEARIAPGT